jgi:alpha-N-acetylglucosamine transferase
MAADSKHAWVTLLTRPSYLAGVIILAHTLQKYQTKYPLIVLVTDTLPEQCITALEAEGQRTNQLHVHKVDPLLPLENVNLIAARFEDTWTKLRVFELITYDKIVFLDADMMICRNMDSLFNIPSPVQTG